MRNLTELNINERGRPVGRPTPTDATIQAFESHFGIKLPSELLTLLRCSNGGHPELNFFEPIEKSGGAPWAVNRFYHLDDEKDSPSSLWKATKKWQQILGDKVLPFASDSGGNQFFFDLETSPPCIKGCVHDEGFRIVELAPSFAAFIDGLKLDPDMI